MATIQLTYSARRWLLSVSLILNALFIGVAVKHRLPFSTSAQSFSPFHRQRAAIFPGLPVQKNEILFLGDSLVENCEWSELLGVPVANRGIAGDTTADLLSILPTLGHLQAVKTVFVIAGVNDFRQGVDVDAFISRYRALLKALHTAAPAAQITVHGLLPVNPALDPTLSALPPVIRAANSRLPGLAEELGCRYFDLYSAVVDSDGLLNRQYTSDGLHLNAAGYRVWARVIHQLA